MFEREILEEAKKERDYIISLRRHFHMYPELSGEEYNTASKIEETLQSFGLKTTRVGKTGVYAEIKGKKSGENKTIVLRCDIDALPIQEESKCEYKSRNDGVMHSCGHDAHTAGLLGATKILLNHLDDFSGTVRLCFQSAEEIGKGAKEFVKGGFLNGADRTFSCHTESRIPCGKVSLTIGVNNASVDFFRIKIKGKEAHVSTPERGSDALFVASSIVVLSQAIVTRLSSPVDPLLIGIGKLNSGTAYNIVSSSSLLEGTIRAVNIETRKMAKKALEKITQNTSLEYGAEGSIEWEDNAPVLINDKEATKEGQKVGERLFGKENIITDRPLSLGGDDFAEFINAVPGFYAYIGSGSEKPHTQDAHHTSSFDIDEDCLVVMTSLFSAYAINYLNGTC